MALSETRASTQDSTGGTEVATSAPADGSSGALQVTAQVGIKTDYAELARTGITSADTAADMSTSGFAGSSGANLSAAFQALALEIRATCDTAAAQMNGHLVGYDGSNNPLSIGEEIAFAASAFKLSSSGDYLCTRVVAACAAWVKAAFYVDSMTGSTWNVYIRPVSSPGITNVNGNTVTSYQKYI
jgi:hypothetical protein